jgi:hypothetical protein
MPRKSPDPNASSPVRTHKLPFNLLAKSNRGLLLDVVIFIANLFLLRMLSGYVLDLFARADKNDDEAKFILLMACIAMWVLPAAGAVLKRWHFHKRLRDEHKKDDFLGSTVGGCLFNPLFYFCLNLVVMSAIVAGVGQQLVGNKGMDSGLVFVPSIFLGLGLTIFQTYLIYRYFSPPKKPPKSGFLLSPESDLIGDICIFGNMILFQTGWNMLTWASFGRVGSVFEFFGRLFVLLFLALLVYFPPRIFYLAEDIHRRRTWLTMLLANSPVIFKVLIGTNNQADW